MNIAALNSLTLAISCPNCWTNLKWNIRKWLRIQIFRSSKISTFNDIYSFPCSHFLGSRPSPIQRQVKYVVWTGYPVAYWLRSAGFITYWQEEVLCYTALDARPTPPVAVFSAHFHRGNYAPIGRMPGCELLFIQIHIVFGEMIVWQWVICGKVC